MCIRREQLGGGCYSDIEEAEDICLTCGIAVRSYERDGQTVHTNFVTTGDAKAPTCTEDGYDYTTTTCGCGKDTHTNNSTYPAHGHAFNTYCTGELSEDETKVKYISKCPACDLIEAEWWE